MITRVAPATLAMVALLNLIADFAPHRIPPNETAVGRQAPKGGCLDPAGAAYSQGAMVRVTDQLEQCVAGKWTFPADDPPMGADALAKQKSCLVASGPDKGQEYGSGLLRRVGDAVDQCDDGKWVKKDK
jgi:hypothetical protein